MKLFSIALGIAAGYGAARVLEARSIGVPLSCVFDPKHLLKPVSVVKQIYAVGGMSTLAAKTANTGIIDVTPIDAVT